MLSSESEEHVEEHDRAQNEDDEQGHQAGRGSGFADGGRGLVREATQGSQEVSAKILAQILPADKVLLVGASMNFAQAYREKFPVEQFDKKTLYALDDDSAKLLWIADKTLEFYGYAGRIPLDVPIGLWAQFDAVVCLDYQGDWGLDEALALAKLCKDKDAVCFAVCRTPVLRRLDAWFSQFFDYVQVIRVGDALIVFCTHKIDTSQFSIGDSLEEKP